MMSNISFISMTPSVHELQHSTMDNDTGKGNSSYNSLEEPVVFGTICVVCFFGVVGNGIVIWLLGFHMKRNPFTVYILNLAVADFGVLLSLPVTYILESNALDLSVFVAESCFGFVYCVSLFLLTFISIDRCVSVLFPFWYRCNRPERLSTVLCTLIWFVSFLVNGICVTLHLLDLFIYISPLFYVFLMNAMICLPLNTISTLILVIQICFKIQLRQQGKLLMAILLSLLFFLTLAFPMNTLCLVYFASSDPYYMALLTNHLFHYGALGASLNCFVNPLIYFLVGRGKRGLCKESLKHILQRIFNEKEICAENLQS